MKPIITEKAVMMIEAKNTLVFEMGIKIKKPEIKKEFEEVFNVKIKRINTHIKDNKKYAYIQLKPEFPAIDIATKLGLM
ncbi:MAG: 50S ribosomal protein L23 [Nanoarchaeota archaeon]